MSPVVLQMCVSRIGGDRLLAIVLSAQRAPRRLSTAPIGSFLSHCSGRFAGGRRAQNVSDLTLPIGLRGSAPIPPGRMASFFLVCQSGGAAASLYGSATAITTRPASVLPSSRLSGRHESCVLAEIAFFLSACWEFMSLASWRSSWRTIVKRATPKRVTSTLLMASFGTLALLLAFGLWRPRGRLRICRHPRGSPHAVRRGRWC